jgi:hypothetical protein
VDVLNEQKESTPKAVWNKSMQHASGCSETPDISTPAKTTVKTVFKHIPVIVNTEVITNNCDNIKSTSIPELSRIAKTNNYNRKIRGPNEANKHKIMVIGDSHCRGSVRNVSDYLGGKFVVTGMTKPGAGALNILTLTNLKYRHLTRKDVIIVQGRSNDVYSNNTKLALTQIVHFCEDLSYVNIIILSLTDMT